VGHHGGPRRTSATAIIVHRSMCEFVCYRNHHVPLLFLPFCQHRCHTSFPHDVPAQITRHNDRSGIEASEPTARMPTGTLFLASSGRHHQLYSTLLYVFLRRTKPTSPRAPQCKWSTSAAMVPHSRRLGIKKSPNMLAD
jgi:hypothetical protein